MALVLGLGWWLAAAPAHAATDLVTSTADSATQAGTLRYELAHAGAGDTIAFVPGLSGTITLSAPVAFAQSLTIAGPGGGAITIDAAGHGSAFILDGSGPVALSGLAFAHATTSAILATGGQLTVTDSTFTADAATGVSVATGGSGGAIDADGASAVTLTADTFSADTAGVAGAGTPVNGLGQGGAVAVSGASSLSISDSTFSGNSATGGGGAIATSVPTTLASDTIDANRVAAGAAGAAILGGADVSSARGTIVAGNLGAPDCDAPVAASGYDLEWPVRTGCGFTASTDVSADPLLHALADNGGPAPTQAIATTSPAYGAIPAGLCPTSTDERGAPRPGLHKTACDIGAYEYQLPRVTLIGLSCPALGEITGHTETCTALVTDIDAPGTKTLPEGTVVFSVTPASAGTFAATTCTLSPASGFSNQATCEVPYTPQASGTEKLSALYLPSDGHAASAVSDTLLANLQPTHTALGSSAPAAVAGQSVVYTATVAPAPDGGTVTFEDAGQAIAGCAGVHLQGTQARCATTYPLVAGHAIEALYAGDAHFAGSESTPLTETIASSLSLRGSPSGRDGRVALTLVCAAASGGCPGVTVELVTVQTLRGRRVTAVTARARPRTTHRLTAVARRGTHLAAGHRMSITVRLNRIGQGLLTRFHRLPIVLTIALRSRGASTAVLVRTLTVRPAAPRPRR